MNVFRYNVSNLELVVPGEDMITIDNSRILDMELIKDYDNYFFPIFRISMNMNLYDIYILRKYNNDAKIHLRMTKIPYDAESDFNPETVIINKMFTPIMEDITPDLESKLNALNKEDTSDEFLNYKSRIELYLVCYEDIISSKNLTNVILNNTDVSTALTYTFYKAGLKNVLMSKVDNIKKYDQIIIPPGTMIQTIMNLEKMYGIFKTYSTLFFDYDTTYLLDKKGSSTAQRFNEKLRITFKIFSDDDNRTFICGTEETKFGYDINVNRNALIIDDNSSSNDAILGSNFININLTNGDINDIESNVDQVNGKSNYRFTVSNYDNPFIAMCEKHGIEENSKGIYIGLRDYDISSLTPNKEFVISFDNTELSIEHSGIYRMSMQRVLFTKEGEIFRGSGSVYLKRSKKK